MNNPEGLQPLNHSLSGLPQWVSERILQQINRLTHYEPVIGIMGKTGAGRVAFAMLCLSAKYRRSAMWQPVPVNLCDFACRLASAI